MPCLSPVLWLHDLALKNMHKISVYIPTLTKVGFTQGLQARESEYKSKVKTEDHT